MRDKLRGRLGFLIIGLAIGSLCSGVAVAKIVIPPGSVTYKSLSPGLQKKVNHAGQPGPTGPQGEKGPTGATGPQGPPGQDLEPPEPPLPPEEEPVIATGLLSPFADVPLSRGHNAQLVMLEDTPGIWCIEPEGIDTATMIVHVSPAEEPVVTTGGDQIPVVRWHVVPSFCGDNEAEIETAIYDTLEGEFERTSALPFTFIIEEG